MAARPVAIVLASRCGERFLANGGTGFKLQAMLDGPPCLKKRWRRCVRRTCLGMSKMRVILAWTIRLRRVCAPRPTRLPG